MTVEGQSENVYVQIARSAVIQAVFPSDINIRIIKEKTKNQIGFSSSGSSEQNLTWKFISFIKFPGGSSVAVCDTKCL